MHDRRSLTYAACDALARAGKKPAIASVREWTLATHGKKQGSDTDVQGDIHAWFQELLSLKQEKLVVAGLPDEVAALARALWLKANDAAAAALDAERAENRTLVDRAHHLTLESEVKAIEAHERAEARGHALDIAGEAIRRLEEALSETRTTAAAIEERHAGQLQLRDERIAALTTDFTRKEAEYAARITELDGVRKHALLQIDEARVESRHWKCEFDRVDAENKSSVMTYRQRASALDAELAGVRGRLGAVEEALAVARGRCTQLETAATTARSESVEVAAGPRRSGAGRVRATALVKRRK